MVPGRTWTWRLDANQSLQQLGDLRRDLSALKESEAAFEASLTSEQLSEFQAQVHRMNQLSRHLEQDVDNPNYRSTFVFTNDFAALQPDVPHARIDEGARELLVSESEAGTCRVVCFSPRHDMTLPRMSLDEIAAVVDVWTHEYAESRIAGLHQ